MSSPCTIENKRASVTLVVLASLFPAPAVPADVTDDAAFRMPAYVAADVPEDVRMAALSDRSAKTPVVKQFDANWVRTLGRPGEPIVYTRAASADFEYIGMPIGGIGAGQLYLGGDGALWCWDIFNTKTMRDVRGVPTHARPYRRSEPDRRAHHQINQGFAIRTQNLLCELMRDFMQKNLPNRCPGMFERQI